MRTALSEHIGQYSGRFKVGGYKTFLDGSPQARTAWLREPYCGAEKNYRGYPRMSNEELAGYVDRALDENMQLLVHCNGDAACEQYLRVYGERLRARAASGKPCRAIRPVIIHAQMLAPDQLSRAAQNGMIPSFFVAHVYHWGDVHLENLGPERAAHQPRGLCGRTGPPLYVPSGCARYPAGHAGDCMVRSEPRYKAGDGAGAAGARSGPGCSARRDHQCGIPVF